MTDVPTPAAAALLTILRERGYERREQAFALSSGGMSHDYVDCRAALAGGDALHAAAVAVLEVIAAADVSYAAVGGMTMGADPIAHAIAIVGETRWFSVRKETKEHGAGRRLEGAEVVAGTRVVVVDDVSSTGGAIIKTLDALDEVGAEVVLATVLLDRGPAARAAVEARGIRYAPVLTHVEFGIDPI